MQLSLSQPELYTLLRTFIINFSTNVCVYYLLFFLFPKRRHTKLLIFFAIFRFSVDFFLTNIYIHTSTLSRSLYLANIFLLSIIMYLVFSIVFCYSAVLVWVAATLSELLSSFIALACLIFLNTIEGRYSITVLSAPFEFPDLLLLVMIPGCAILFTKIFGNYIRTLTTRFKHPEIIGTVLICYIIIALFSRTTALTEMASVSLVILLFACLSLFLLLGPTQLNLSKARSRQAKLTTQQKLIASYLATIQKQIANIKETQELIDAQMKKITRQDASISDTASFTSYLAELEEHYASLKVSSYSDNWMLDTVVSSHAEQCKEKQIDFHCSLVGYHTGVVEEWHFVEFLTFLLDYGMQLNESVPPESRKLSISIATIKNTLAISFSSSWDGNGMVSNRMFRKYLSSYHSDIQIEKEATTLKIAFSLLEDS